MSSNINPNNINGNYPIAGQDNDSQGFRDNFTNIRTNLTYAQKEIEDLQNKAILKASLIGSSNTVVTNDMTGVGLVGATTAAFTSLASIDDSPKVGSIQLEFSNGDLHKYTAGGNITIGLGWNPVAANTYAKMRLWLTITDVLHLVTFPAEVSIGLTDIGDVTELTLTPEVGEYLLEFSTIDAGSTVMVSLISGPNNLSGLAAVSSTLIATNGNVAILQSNVSTLQSNVSTLQSNVSTLQSNVSTLQTGISSLTTKSLTDLAATAPLQNDHLRYQSSGQWINVPYPGDLVTFTTTIVDNGAGVSVFALNGTPLKTSGGVTISPAIKFKLGNRYRFDLSHSSNSNGPLRFSTTSDVLPSSITDYTANVVTEGTPGSSGAYTEITITENTPSTLFLHGVSAVTPNQLGGGYPIETGVTESFTGSENVLAGSIIDPLTSASYFTTSVGATATLQISKNGHVKTLACNGGTGSMVVNVLTHAWAGAGTITFTTAGQTCTLQFINNKWFIVANNGAAVA